MPMNMQKVWRLRARSRGLGRAGVSLALLLCLFLAMGGLCGCSTVQPELTAEERVYNQQLREQETAHGVLLTDDGNIAETVLAYVVVAAMEVLYGLGQAGYSFRP
jgi:hypothetical protein